MPVKPTLDENEYFARQEAERMRKWAQEREAKLAQEERERRKALHFMKCPKCGADLEEIALSDVKVDKCFQCEGMWLDSGELDRITRKDAGFVRRLVSVFGR